MTGDDLREGWLEQIDRLNGMIDRLNAGNNLHQSGKTPDEATEA